LEGARTYLEQDKEREIRCIVLVTPSNPTGTVYTPAELREWYDLAKEYSVCLILDETYRDFVGDGRESAPHGLFDMEEWGRTLVSISSMSSEYFSSVDSLSFDTIFLL
jgi:aspartate/methionine/tyrosine aminotransferase